MSRMCSASSLLPATRAWIGAKIQLSSRDAQKKRCSSAQLWMNVEITMPGLMPAAAREQARTWLACLSCSKVQERYGGGALE
jgi:hypothetical protein